MMSRKASVPAPAPPAALSDVPVDDAWFAAAVCRNCDAPLAAPYCCRCGQKAARRFAWRDIVKESWERLRLFELNSLKTVGRLLLTPGSVARDYVMGRRAAHMHPLKLLVALVAALVLLLAANQYFATYEFAGRDSDVDAMAKRVMTYANWSFSLGIFAILLGAQLFRRRLGYNFIEHVVLAIYAQSLILALIIVNMLPTLIWRDPGFVLSHKAASQYYIFALKIVVVAAAYWQFFRLRLRADWLRLLLACLLYAAASWALLRVYALTILWLVSR